MAAGLGTWTSASWASPTSGADLAVATWGTEWNYGPGWDGLLLDAYGAPPDTERTRYYRLL
jgi:aminoglycoside phosphotransferase